MYWRREHRNETLQVVKTNTIAYLLNLLPSSHPPPGRPVTWSVEKEKGIPERIRNVCLAFLIVV